MNSLRAIEPARDEIPEHPSWDGVWHVEDLARFVEVNPQTIYGGIQSGAWDFALIPGTGRSKRFSGPALAARFMVPGYAEGGTKTGADKTTGSETWESPSPRY